MPEASAKRLTTTSHETPRQRHQSKPVLDSWPQRVWVTLRVYFFYIPRGVIHYTKIDNKEIMWTYKDRESRRADNLERSSDQLLRDAIKLTQGGNQKNQHLSFTLLPSADLAVESRMQNNRRNLVGATEGIGHNHTLLYYVLYMEMFERI